jgi:hypothetical protein
LETSKVLSLTASTEAPMKAPIEGKHWPLPQLVSFQASTQLKPLKWCGRCDSSCLIVNSRQKMGEHPPAHSGVGGVGNSNMTRRNPQWGPNNNSTQRRLPDIRLFGDTQFRAPPNPKRPNRLWGRPQTTGSTYNYQHVSGRQHMC